MSNFIYISKFYLSIKEKALFSGLSKTVRFLHLLRALVEIRNPSLISKGIIA